MNETFVACEHFKRKKTFEKRFYETYLGIHFFLIYLSSLVISLSSTAAGVLYTGWLFRDLSQATHLICGEDDRFTATACLQLAHLVVEFTPAANLKNKEYGRGGTE